MSLNQPLSLTDLTFDLGPVLGKASLHATALPVVPPYHPSPSPPDKAAVRSDAAAELDRLTRSLQRDSLTTASPHCSVRTTHSLQESEEVCVGDELGGGGGGDAGGRLHLRLLSSQRLRAGTGSAGGPDVILVTMNQGMQARLNINATTSEQNPVNAV